MNTTQKVNLSFEGIAWGALFIWWGITVLIPALPKGIGMLGIGLILAGTNLARRLSGVPINQFSTTIGILALVWGALELVGALVSFPFELPVFAILLIVLGIIVLAPALTKEQDH